MDPLEVFILVVYCNVSLSKAEMELEGDMSVIWGIKEIELIA